jgi:hypothetical protein
MEENQNIDQNKIKKIKIVLVLSFLLILFLLLKTFYPGAKSFLKDENSRSSSSDISSLDSGIDGLLDNYGIKKEWRYKKVVPISASFSRYERSIFIPYKIPMINLNHDIVELCNRFDATTSSTENIKNQILSVYIKYNNNVIESIKFITDPNLERIKGLITMSLEGFEDLDELNQVLLLQSPIFTTFVFKPESVDEKVINKILKFQKEYFIFIDIKTKNDDDRYGISTDLDSAKIQKKFKDIFRTYDKTKGIIYRAADTTKAMFSYIKNEATRYRKCFIDIKGFQRLEESENSFKNIDDVTKQSVLDGKSLAVCLLRNNNLKKTYDSFNILQKKGFRFVKMDELPKQN